MYDHSKVEHYRFSSSIGTHEIKWGLRRVDNGERVVSDDCLLLVGHARHFYIDLYDTEDCAETLLDQLDFDCAIAPFIDLYWEEDLGCTNREGFLDGLDCHLYDKETLEQLALIMISTSCYHELMDTSLAPDFRNI